MKLENFTGVSTTSNSHMNLRGEVEMTKECITINIVVQNPHCT